MAEFIPTENFNPEDININGEEDVAPTWLDQYGVAFIILVISVFMFIGSFALLSWNEYKTVDEVWKLNEGSRLVVSLASDQPDSDNNGQMVHVTGAINTKDVLSDELFFISVPGVKLEREVEMYQWVEGSGDKKSDADRGVVSYNKIWARKAINSSKFKQQQGHVNPPMELMGTEYTAANVKLGGFVLSERFILELKSYIYYPMTEESFAQINPEMQGFVLYNGGFYKGKNPQAPEIGDLKVSYRVVNQGNEVSAIGMQNVDKLEPYHTDYNTFNLLTEGKVDADTMLRREVNARDVQLIWQLRFGAWFAMLVSISMAMYSFTVLERVLPGVAALVGYNYYEMGIFLSLACTLITVAMAWLPYRSGFAVGLMVLGGSLLIVATFLKKKPMKVPELKMRKKKKTKKAKPAKVKAPKKSKEAIAELPKEIPAKVRFLKAPKKD